MKNFAVIGYGGQGAWHCSQILKRDVAHLCGTYDIKENRRQAATEAECTIFALEHGLHVLLEKPMTVTLDEAKAIMKAEKKSGKIVSVGFQPVVMPICR